MKNFSYLFKLLVTLFLVVIFIQEFKAQRNIHEDFGNWIGSEFSYKIAKKTYLVGALSLRTHDNGSRLRRFHYEFGIEKKFFKLINVGFKYRNRFLFDYDDFTVNNRFILDLAYKKKLGNFGIQLRNRSQYTFQNGLNPFVNRIRVKLDYKLEKDLKIYVYEEFFYRMNHRRGNNWSGRRFGFGIKYDISKKVGLDLSYVRINLLNRNNPINFNILQLEVNLNF